MPARAPEDCDRLFAEYVNAGDLEALIALYEPTCTMVQHDGSVVSGHAAIRAALGRLTAMRAKIGIDIVKVVTAGDDLAMVYNDWTLSARDGAGRPIERGGKAIEVVRRQADGTWRVAVDDPLARG